jgi:polysaccharide export outer membrane protein
MMKVRSLCGKESLGVVLWFLIAASSAVAQTTTTPASAPAAAPQPSAEAKLDLNDPKVRDRLKAAGVDPDELQKLMGANPMAAAASANGTTTGLVPASGMQFPPVIPPPGARQVQTDSLRLQPVAVDSTNQEPKNFGYDIFTLKPTTFEPLAFGPVPANYLLGPGDELLISVWGAQEQSSRATINREGYVILPDVGPVMANGLTLDGFKAQLEKRLARIYSGIGREGRSRTSVDVSLGKLRSIQVFVLGDVVQPGGYTLTATSTIMNALYYAGGPTMKGSLRNLRVTRNNQVVHRADLYDYLARGTRSEDFRLENGDVVFVPPVSRQVTLEGEVRHPAIYELRDGDRVSDLLEISGGFTAAALRSRIQVERVIPYQERKAGSPEDRKVLDLDLQGNGTAMELADGDIVRVFRNRDILKNTVKLVGTAVYKPGTYELQPGMTVADLIEEGGGLLGEAYTGWAHLVRTRNNKTRELRSFNLAAALQRQSGSNIELAQLDEVQIFSIWDVHDPEHVSIQGLVRHPGSYDMLEGMTVTDLIVKAGGLRESAYRVRAEVSRIDPGAISEGKTADVLYVVLGDSLNTESDASRFALRKNDIVFVREIPNWGLQENVWVTGEVRFPGVYSLTSKTEPLSSIIDRAGGLEPTAYLQAATFTRKKDGTGRMAIDFEKALRSKNRKSNKFDLAMAAGDSINIPREPRTVKVVGDVGFPSSVLWEDGRNMNYYIDQAGGTLSTADKGKITVVMANGRVERPGFFNKPNPDAGATIHVPRKPERKDTEGLKIFAEVMSVLSGAATTIYLISQSAKH